MFRDGSQKSLSTAQSASIDANVFSRQMLTEVEALTVELPRGMRAHGSPHIAGEMRGAREVKVPVRKYSVTVEPNGRMKKPKDAMREAARPVSEIELDLQRRSVNSREASPVDEVLDDRHVFRRERVRRFQLGVHFPALVTPRLVPSWRLSAAGELSMQGGDQPKGLNRPTASMIRKRQTKRQENHTTPWLVTGAAGAGELICDRKPVLHADHYDSPREIQRDEDDYARECWVSDVPILPTSVASAKLSCDSSRPQLESQIAAMRERGRALNESLRERYETQRHNFQMERDAQVRRQGGLSTFAFSMKRKQQALVAAQLAPKPGPTIKVKKDEEAAARLSRLESLGSFRHK